MGELNLERSKVKFDLWERKLLDLSTRNSLLNLRIKGSAVPVFVPECANIEDLIAQDKNFTIISRGEDDEPEEEETASEETETGGSPEVVQSHQLCAVHRFPVLIRGGIRALAREVEHDDVETVFVGGLYQAVVAVDELDIASCGSAQPRVACRADSAVGLAQVADVVGVVCQSVQR